MKTRRTFLQTTAAAGVGYWLGSESVLAAANAASEKLNIAVIGVGGRGAANLNGVQGENIVALCDVDDHRAGNAYKRFPKARKFHDFRRMYDQMENQIDAVVVNTPDHTHFHPAMMALQAGKHLYCEKPMAHSVEEVRVMTQTAREKNVVTQLGVQRHTIDNVHRVVELIQAGAIGDVSEVHCWIGGDRGMPDPPREFPPVPSHLRWDLWLGPATDRPYSPEYVPYKWRFWWDFGTGEMGNWGCHTLDIPFWALGLKYPTRVDASGPEIDPQRTPKSMETRFDFPEVEGRPAVSLYWYHAKNGPPILQEHGLSHKGNNTLFIGSEGMLLCGYGQRKLYPEEKFADFAAPDRTISDSPGFYREWIEGCKGGAVPTCHFDYSGPLTETVLLGNTAYRAGGGFDWDAEKFVAHGNPRVNEFLYSRYRAGWELPGLRAA